MVRSADRRKQAYEAKIDADVQRSRILALKTMMVEQVEAKFADLATVEAEVKKVVEGATTKIYGHMIPAYLNVGRELYKLSKKFTATTMTEEAKLVADKWYGKGLDKWLIRDLLKLFGVAYTPA